jgi:3-dehydroshikimate dehydratase
MIQLSAFADEISPNLDEQIAVLHSENIHFIDLRSVWGVNVLDFSDEQVDIIKKQLQEQGIGVAAIASPIGKVSIDSPFATHLQRFERSIQLAHAFGTPYIRLFSFYPPQHAANVANDPIAWRGEVIKHLQDFTARAQAAQVILLHENEKDIYGDIISRCVDLYQTINNPHLRNVLDPANFLQCAQVPYPDAYTALKPWTQYIHVKDVKANGTLVPAGEGDAHWPELLQQLRADGYSGFLALEPHLSAAGQFQGFSGPALFRKASQALQKLLHDMDWQLS